MTSRQRYVEASPRFRVSLGLAACLAMWAAAASAVGIYLTSWSIGFDGGDPNAGEGVGAVALALAVMLFVGSGPVAFKLSGRRWTLLLPLLALVIWSVGIGLAAAT